MIVQRKYQTYDRLDFIADVFCLWVVQIFSFYGFWYFFNFTCFDSPAKKYLIIVSVIIFHSKLIVTPHNSLPKTGNQQENPNTSDFSLNDTPQHFTGYVNIKIFCHVWCADMPTVTKIKNVEDTKKCFPVL